MPTKIELMEWEWNLILRTLGEKPYCEVASVIRHIEEQIDKNKIA